MGHVINTFTWEQGTIGSNGSDSYSNTRVRATGYFEVNLKASVTSTFVITVYDTNDTPLQANIMMYDQSKQVVYDNGWHASGEVLNYNKNIYYIRIVLSYPNSSNITPSNIKSCIVTYDTDSCWYVRNNELRNTAFVDAPNKPFHGDSPYTFWRIEEGVNNGAPYGQLMVGVPGLALEKIDRLPLAYKREKLRFFMNLITKEDTNYSYILDEHNYATLVYYRGNRNNIKVPRIIDGYEVKCIAETCFNDHLNITSVEIPDGIEVIS